MRRLIVTLLVAVSAAGHAQSVGDVAIRGSLQALSTNPTIFLNMVGTDTLDGNGSTASVVKGYTYSAYFQVSQVKNRVYALVNLTEYNGTGPTAKPVMVFVGDGVTLWRYDCVNNSYSAVNYGTYAGDQPQDYSATLFRDLGSMMQGYMSYPVTLLRQIYGGEAGYESWLPGVDPVTDTAGDVTYSIGSPPRRTITFMLGTGALTQVAYDDTTKLRELTKTTDWKMDILSGINPNSSLFVFTPPAGARPVAFPHLPPRPTF